MQSLVREFGFVAFVGLAMTNVAAARDVAATIEDATVERAADGSAVVRWRSLPAGAPVDVSIARSGERQVQLISEDDRDGKHELRAQDAARRPLVHLTTSSGATLVTAERLLPLEGGRNFRDLGGYRTADGRRVKWGKVYRSGTMAQLTDGDYDFLSGLGIRVICDFRTNEERELEPTVWGTKDAKVDYRTRDYSAASSGSRLKVLFESDTATPETVRAAMISLYGDLAYQHAQSYRTMFKSLAAGEAPLAFNCAAGKDRTGVAAALLLTMLGVPQETVVEDYALSERMVNFEAQFAKRPAATAKASKPGPWDFIAKLSPEVRAPLLRSDPEYIRAALAHIEQREGSIDAYFERVLSITRAEQQAIRDLLLESGNASNAAVAAR